MGQHLFYDTVPLNTCSFLSIRLPLPSLISRFLRISYQQQPLLLDDEAIQHDPLKMDSNASLQQDALSESLDSSLLCLPPTLISLLSNTLVLTHTLPYLPLSALNALSRTSNLFNNLITTNPLIFRLLDLSLSRSAYLNPSLSTPIDGGGYSWRSERIDENLTEDEFYCGPLRGILNKLSVKGIMQNVNVLILDGLASVTADLVEEIVRRPEYHLRMLSVVGCVNLNQRKLQQLLVYLCRESRPEGTPKLEGIYVFGTGIMKGSDRDRGGGLGILGGITMTEGATLGSIPMATSGRPISWNDDGNPWYTPTGRVITEGYAQRSSWEEILQVCKGIIAFDAVLCTHMHVEMASYLHDASKDYLSRHKPSVPPFASVALGPEGCSGCGKAPEGSPTWGENHCMEFPLLRPPPFSGRVVDAVRPPKLSGMPRRLIASCTWCLANRHCESCHRWWCGICYDPKRKTAKLKELEKIAAAGLDYFPSRLELSGGSSTKSEETIKVFNNLCVEHCLVGEMMAGAGSGGMWG